MPNFGSKKGTNAISIASSKRKAEMEKENREGKRRKKKINEERSSSSNVLVLGKKRKYCVTSSWVDLDVTRVARARPRF